MWLISSGSELKLHNCGTYEVEHVYRPSYHSEHIRNISWCKDGSWLALVPFRGNPEIIRTKDDLRLLQSVLGVAHPTVAVFQKTTKKNLAMSTLSGEIFVYDIKSRVIKKYFTKSPAKSVICMDWSYKDTHLATGITTGEIDVYSTTTSQKSSTLTLPGSKTVSVVRFHATQRSILGTASDEGVVVVWDINCSKKKLCIKSHQAPVTDMAFSSQSRNLMISVGLDRTFQCYDINAGTAQLSVLTDHPLSTVDMAPDGYTIAAGTTRGSIYVYDLREHKNPLTIIAAHVGEVKKILYQPTGLTSESVNINEEKIPGMTNLETKQNISAESFGLHMVTEFSTSDTNLVSMQHETDNKLESKSVENDSFFTYLDVNIKRVNNHSKNLTEDKPEMSSMRISDGIKKFSDFKQQSYESHEKVSDVLPTLTINHAASTPQDNKNTKLTAVLNQELSTSNFSPVLTGSTAPINKCDLKMIKDVVKEVVADQTSDLMYSLSRNFLNLQMCLSKHFVYQETEMERLAEHLQNMTSNSTLQNQQLMEENKFLKSKINELMK